MRAAVFLDRDGVLNEVTVADGLPSPPSAVAAMRLLPGVQEACAALKEAGFLLAQSPQFITLAKERSTDGEKGKVQYDDVTIIMRSDILELRVFDASQGKGEDKGKGKSGA